MQNIIGEVKIIFRKCTADIIFLVPSFGDKILILRNYYVIASLLLTVGRRRSLTSFLPSSERTTFDISRLIKSMLSSSSRIPFVVIVNRKFLLCSFSIDLAYSTTFLTTIEIHERLAAEEIKFEVVSVCRMFDRKSIAALPTSKGMSFLPWPKSP